ncbi:MAG: hypothetical protein CK429_35160 [Mycobacterium sp.]|nr:MAG: hypothetical protein CK429_35160 [Mycobacterium sp.]
MYGCIRQDKRRCKATSAESDRQQLRHHQLILASRIFIYRLEHDVIELGPSAHQRDGRIPSEQNIAVLAIRIYGALNHFLHNGQ